MSARTRALYQARVLTCFTALPGVCEHKHGMPSELCTHDPHRRAVERHGDRLPCFRLIGILPAFLLLYVRRQVDEPALWVTANADRREARKSVSRRP
jgi:hypothetical protein